MTPDYIKTPEGYAYEYPRAAMTADAVIFGFDGYELQVLLIQRGIEPYKGRWAFPGGFMRMDETIEECAVRELYEETGLHSPYMQQLGIFSDV
ncbi:MAG: NUDIX hydrolase, partial [Paludibacteraceae bacterium]|nr:NUDIX hydrolase [Paludibacteraceae bacterium]